MVFYYQNTSIIMIISIFTKDKSYTSTVWVSVGPLLATLAHN